MNIVYCLDRNYYPLTLISAKSVKEHNPDANFYFFANDLMSWQYLHLKNMGQVIEYDADLLAEFTTELCGYKHVSKACFIRLLVPMYLKDLERCLYLDGDTVCKGDISKFYNSDFENNYIIGCEGIDYSKKQAKELDIEFYINSGVLLFNNTLMNKDNYFKQIKETWKGTIGKPKVYSADETIINYVFHKKIKLISERYNYCYNRPYTGRALSPQQVKIWHVTGANKGNIQKCLTMKTH